MSRNVVDEETAERNRTVGIGGGYTFHAVIPLERAGEHGLTVAAVRVDQHAHVHVMSGRISRRSRDDSWVEPSYGEAGWLVLRWPEWLVFRQALDLGSENVRICEVEKPTLAQAKYALAHGSVPKAGVFGDG